MLILTQEEARKPIKLPGGVMLHCRPISKTDYDLAEGRVVSNLARAADGEEVAMRYGLTTARAQSFVDHDLRIGTAALAIELGIEAIQTWEGLGRQLPLSPEDQARQARGESVEKQFEPAPVELPYIILLMNAWTEAGQSYADLFLQELRSRALPRLKEGKHYAASLSGSGAAAANGVNAVS